MDDLRPHHSTQFNVIQENEQNDFDVSQNLFRSPQILHTGVQSQVGRFQNSRGMSPISTQFPIGSQPIDNETSGPIRPPFMDQNTPPSCPSSFKTAPPQTRTSMNIYLGYLFCSWPVVKCLFFQHSLDHFYREN